MNLFGNQQWLVIALAFFGILAYVAWIRRKDQRWIERHFGKDRVRAMSFGVNYFGLATEVGRPRRSSGFLLLLPDRVFFRSRVAKLEVDIPGNRIVRATHGRRHKGVDLHQSVMKIEYLSPEGTPDCAAFKVPYPPSGFRRFRRFRPPCAPTSRPGIADPTEKGGPMKESTINIRLMKADDLDAVVNIDEKVLKSSRP